MKVRDLGNGAYAFYCPGCEHEHVYYTGDHRPIEARWEFNGKMDNPSFTPSLLNRWGKHAKPDFVEPTEEPPQSGWSGICHLFVTDGHIHYCGDCTHHMNGKTNVEMKEY